MIIYLIFNSITGVIRIKIFTFLYTCLKLLSFYLYISEIYFHEYFYFCYYQMVLHDYSNQYVLNLWNFFLYNILINKLMYFFSLELNILYVYPSYVMILPTNSYKDLIPIQAYTESIWYSYKTFYSMKFW